MPKLWGWGCMGPHLPHSACSHHFIWLASLRVRWRLLLCKFFWIKLNRVSDLRSEWYMYHTKNKSWLVLCGESVWKRSRLPAVAGIEVSPFSEILSSSLVILNTVIFKTWVCVKAAYVCSGITWFTADLYQVPNTQVYVQVPLTPDQVQPKYWSRDSGWWPLAHK